MSDLKAKIFVGKSQRLSSKLSDDLKNQIIEETSFYPLINLKTIDIKVRAYIIKNNIKEDDLKCKQPLCDNFVKFNSPSKGFGTYCSPKCSNTSIEFIKSQKETNLKKYGHEYNFASEDSIKKKKETNLKKYGHTNILCSDKVKQTNLEKFGTEYASQSHMIKDKVKQTNLEKFGTESFQHSHIKSFDNWYNADFIKSNFLDSNNHIMVRSMMEYFNVCQPAVHKKFKELSIDFTKRKGTSFAETEILTLIPDAIQSDKIFIGKELDILSYKHKFAIEYHGLMFHSYGISKYSMFNSPVEDRNRHVVKLDMVEQKDFQLYQIFENEWIYKRKIWESVINSKIGNTVRIFARKCVIKEVNDSTNFELLNHLQGPGKSSIRLGLYYNDELVSLMTFGKSRYDKRYQYELIRFCSKLNTTVIGGASKLLKYFERNYEPESIISYANRRWSNGNLYEVLGFEYTHTTPPNYFYFKGLNLESRVKYQKHKLKKLLKQFDDTKTETSNMFQNNFRKIFDAGNKTYIKTYIKELT